MPLAPPGQAAEAQIRAAKGCCILRLNMVRLGLNLQNALSRTVPDINTMDPLVSKFMTWLAQEKGYSAHTLRAYQNDLSQFVTFCRKAGRADARSVNQKLITAFLGAQIASERSRGTIARRRSAIRSFFRYLARLHIVDSDPCSALQPLKRKEHLPAFLDPNETERLLSAPLKARLTSFARTRDAAILCTLYSSGIRVGEGAQEHDQELGGGVGNFDWRVSAYP